MDAAFDILADLPNALKDPNRYPAEIHAVELLETATAWVILAQNVIYKVRRPCSDEGMEANSLDRLRRSLEEEMRLQGPLARGVYIGVVPPITYTEEGSLQVEGHGQPVAWAVKMWRHSERRTLDRLVERGEITETLMDAVAETLLSVHLQARGGDLPPNPEPQASLRSRIERVCDSLTQGSFLRGQFSGEENCSNLTALLAHFSAYLQSPHSDGSTRGARAPWVDLRSPLGAPIPPGEIVVCASGRAEVANPAVSKASRFADVAEDMVLIVRKLSVKGQRAMAHALVRNYTQLSSDSDLWERVRFYACLASLEEAVEAEWHGLPIKDIAVLLFEAFSWSAGAPVLLIETRDHQVGCAPSKLPAGLLRTCAQSLHYGLFENLVWAPEERSADLVIAELQKGCGQVISHAQLSEPEIRELVASATAHGHEVLELLPIEGTPRSTLSKGGLTQVLRLPEAIDTEAALLRIVAALARGKRSSARQPAFRSGASA